MTDDAATVEQHAFELEVASDYWKDFAKFGAALKHGLTKRMDLCVAFGCAAVPSELRAAQPLELSLKYNFVPEHFTVSMAGTFNSATYAVNAIYTPSSEPLSVHVNLGFEATAENRNVVLTYGIAAVFNAAIAAIGAEIGGVDNDLNWWQIGTQINLLEWLAIDAGLGGDFNKDMELIVTSGLWFYFGGELKHLKKR